DANDAPAINLFAGANDPETEAQVVENFAYIFATIRSALTDKQQTCFTFCARLLYSIKGATLQTLMQLLSDRAPSLSQSRFRNAIAQADPLTQDFFENEFY